ncbi:MAG: D-amino acid dehydrogenase [Rickettsiales bacterium]|nr:D-amino acid dehydrogenase [Pseudomonadota bacterium]MDA0965490.1 D-amino acid dehydrogenase [Pseudomonadota bacterium]MDG4542814.1 D-amino acid dehydrogenase [Rickettsiales bacterium]MDG4544738.1 D-amino acid dehydrogenase [Rickettsiales bacterium]MDG4546860.1 D-amino acid dehydrogenase [Rickettsiales bacterium]
MKILVMGAGVIGVTTAYRLSKSGHDVTVIDKNQKSASECSFANGGQLSYSHVEPWANVNSFKKIPEYLVKKDSPLVIKPIVDLKMWKWCLQFLSCCNTNQALKSSENMLRLAMYSRKCLEEIESDISFDFCKQDNGILHVFKSRKALDFNIEQAKFQEERGCPYELLDSMDKVVEKEPALGYGDMDIIGGIFYPMDGSGDVNKFTVSLAEELVKRGKVKFEYDTQIEEIVIEGNRVKGVKTDKGEISADKYVVCLGAKTPLILGKIGIKIPIYPMKGYSISIPIGDLKDSHVPSVGVTDQFNKIVYSRLGDILRVAGTAEFAGYDDSVEKPRIETLKRMTKYLFPKVKGLENATEWACLRPSTPDGSPIIGKTKKYDNLYLNTGHGTLGWTMSFASSKAIADIVDSKMPEIDLSGLDTCRFGI